MNISSLLGSSKCTDGPYSAALQQCEVELTLPGDKDDFTLVQQDGGQARATGIAKPGVRLLAGVQYLLGGAGYDKFGWRGSLKVLDKVEQDSVSDLPDSLVCISLKPAPAVSPRVVDQ